MQASMYAVEITLASGKSSVLYPTARTESSARTAAERQLAQRAMKATITNVRKI